MPGQPAPPHRPYLFNNHSLSPARKFLTGLREWTRPAWTCPRPVPLQDSWGVSGALLWESCLAWCLREPAGVGVWGCLQRRRGLQCLSPPGRSQVQALASLTSCLVSVGNQTGWGVTLPCAGRLGQRDTAGASDPLGICVLGYEGPCGGSMVGVQMGEGKWGNPAAGRQSQE